MYVLKNNEFYVGKDFRDKPIMVTSRVNACKFETENSAGNFLNCLPAAIRNHNWELYDVDRKDDCIITDIKKFGNHSKTTFMEDESFNIRDFFTVAVEVMSDIDRFISNMSNKEQITDMKILDVRHYIRDNNHKLNAIQMQRLGYYLQDLEKERYKYKSNRLIASMFANNIEALKDKNNIDKMNDIVTSKYNPRILEDSDIEYIINKKKDVEFIA
ncbi:MAG: hypothetical protein IKJ06_00575 [Clostridia bacterium]|nr:hypothetical protein [Clostridia bacterium]